MAARLRQWRAGRLDHGGAGQVAGGAFLIRALGAVVVYLSQIALARWMGGFEFGVYVSIWTWVLLIGDTVHLGLASAAQRFIPEYIQRQAYGPLRGFLLGSRLLVFFAASAVALAAILAIYLLQAHLGRYDAAVLFLACATLPFYALSNMLDGIARSFDRIALALAPPYLLRPVLLIILMVAAHAAGLPMTAATAMAALVIATWATAVLQLVLLNRRLAVAVPPGPRAFDVRGWLKISLPILAGWGFYTLLTYADVLILQQFRPPDEVAHYYSASKTLALVAFIYFAVSAAVAHKFTAYHVAEDRERLAAFLRDAINWTFWPSLVATVAVLVAGRFLLGLFGPGFVEAYPLMFILAVGLLARSSVGPAERLVNMLGEQKLCALVYATACATNVVGCLLLIPAHGALGAALATSAALVVESVLLFWITRRRLGLHLFVFGRLSPGSAR